MRWFLTLSVMLGGISTAAFAYDITTDPLATMNQEQKLGPNVYSYRRGNVTMITRHPRFGVFVDRRYRLRGRSSYQPLYPYRPY